MVGDTVYYTLADSATVFSATLSTMTDNGPVFTVAGATGLASIAYDGTNLWIGDYSGTNNAYYYTPSGTLLKTITLSQASPYYDGLEFFNGKLIANEFDGGLGGANSYDVYDTNGTLLQAGLIQTTQAPTAAGIAFDGTNFWIAGVFDSTLYEYDINGAFLKSLPVTGSTSELFQDLSFDYSLLTPPPPPPPPPGVPEPGTLALMSLGLAAGVFRRRLRS